MRSRSPNQRLVRRVAQRAVAQALAAVAVADGLSAVAMTPQVATRIWRKAEAMAPQACNSKLTKLVRTEARWTSVVTLLLSSKTTQGAGTAVPALVELVDGTTKSGSPQVTPSMRYALAAAAVASVSAAVEAVVAATALIHQKKAREVVERSFSQPLQLASPALRIVVSDSS